MPSLKQWLGPMRVPFLLLPPACVLLGLGSAVRAGARVNWLHFALALVGAVCAHVSVNAFNEWFDHRSGLDATTQRTPFSGGSGTLQASAAMAGPALFTAWASLAITALVGIYFALVRGPAILPLGILGLVVIYAYTPWLTHSPFLCLIAPGLGFGPLMVMGVQFALTGGYTWTSFVASLVPFFLVSDLLLLNQFPDVGPDRAVGRRHFPVLVGRKASSVIYGAFLASAFLSIVVGVALGLLPAACLIGLLGAALAVPAGLNAFRHADDVGKLLPSLGQNVVLNLATPVLVALGLLVG